MKPLWDEKIFQMINVNRNNEQIQSTNKDKN